MWCREMELNMLVMSNCSTTCCAEGLVGDGREDWAWAMMEWVMNCIPPGTEIPNWKGRSWVAKSGEKWEARREPTTRRHAVPTPMGRSLSGCEGSLWRAKKYWALKEDAMRGERLPPAMYRKARRKSARCGDRSEEPINER